MTADEYLRAGRLDEALAQLQATVRDNPAEGRSRIFLFQLLSVLGQWKRAHTQLDVLAELDADSALLAHIFRPVLNCEAFRGEVFEGKRTPLVFGEPAEWVGLLVQAVQLAGQGQYGAANQLREQAFEVAPVNPGTMDGNPFEWIADADMRLGPILEVIMEGRYYWVPFCRIKQIQFSKPTDLRHLVWLQAQCVWTNGGQMAALIPVRYPQTEAAADGPLRLARRTNWQEPVAGYSVGLGQRVLCTDQGEFPLLEIKTLELSTS